jgi:hypothetical protein
MIKAFDFLNNVDPQQLNASLDELEEEIEQIFLRTNSFLDDMLVKEIKGMDEKLFVWFCFLKANFLRGRDTVSNRAFKQFVDFCKGENNCYYFYEFPTQNFLPQFNNPKFLQARKIEDALQDLRKRYGSGSQFVDEIKGLVNQFGIQEIHNLYLELIAMLMSFKGIGSKIANAVLDEISWELILLKRHEKEKFQEFSGSKFISKLILASFFNVMIDIHVKRFFEEKLNIKNVEQTFLILISKNIEKEVIKSLFERNFDWVEYKDVLLKEYHEYFGASVIEKIIWMAYFFKKNSTKKQKQNISNLEFFKLSGNLFL